MNRYNVRGVMPSRRAASAVDSHMISVTVREITPLLRIFRCLRWILFSHEDRLPCVAQSSGAGFCSTKGGIDDGGSTAPGRLQDDRTAQSATEQQGGDGRVPR